MSVIHNIWTSVEEGLTALGDIIWDAAHMIVAMGNAPKCIKSAVLLPIDASLFAGSNEPISLGEYPTGVTGRKLNAGAVARQNFTISIPWQVNDWRRIYHTIYLMLPYSGVIVVPASEVISATGFHILCSVSQNGAVTYEVSAVGNENIGIGVYYGNCAGAFMIGESQTSLLTSISAASSAVGGAAATLAAAATGNVAGAVAAGAGTLSGTLCSMQPNSSMVGGGGGGAYTGSYIASCATIFHDTTVAPDSVAASIGTPAMAQKQIGTLTGYVQCHGASVAADAETPTLEKINAYLNGGFFYE